MTNTVSPRFSTGLWLKLALLALVAFAAGFAYNYHLPKLEAYLLKELKQRTEAQTPLRISGEKLSFHLLPLSVSLINVTISPTEVIDAYLAPINLSEIRLQLALWPLLRGDVRLSQVYLRDGSISVFLRRELFQRVPKPSAKRFNFNQLYLLPVDEILLENIQVQGRVEPQNFVFRVNRLDLALENRYKSIFIDLNAPSVYVKPSGPAKPLDLELELRTLIESDEVQISAVKLKAHESYLVASGQFYGDIAAGKFTKGQFDARTRINLTDIKLWERVFSVKPNLPIFSGQLESELGVRVPKADTFAVDSKFRIAGLEVDRRVVGDVDGEVTSDFKSIQAKKFEIKNSSGKAALKDFQMDLKPYPKGSARLVLHEVEVRQFLRNIRVGNVPIHLPLQGEAKCTFAIPPGSPEINCASQIQARSARVDSDSDKSKASILVAAESLRAQGSFKANIQQVEYDAELFVGKNSNATSTGIINYHDGFKINYVANQLDFKDVKQLVNLKFEGTSKLTGQTVGTSEWATIDMQADGKDLWLEDYPLGNVSAKVTYKDGHLMLNRVQGQFDVTRYNGSIGLDIRQKRIRMSAQIPFMDLKNVQQLFQRKVQLPFLMNGTGTGQVEAEGPLQFNLMSYTFKSSFYRGQISRESFDELLFNVRSIDGHVVQQRISLSKSSGKIDVKGQINPKGEIDAVAIGRTMRLEQSENVLGYGLDLQGIADFSVLIRGQLPHPKVELNGRLSKMILADQPTADSVFKLNFMQDHIEGSGQFLGNTLNTEFTYPYSDVGPFAVKVKTNKWDFTNLFSLVARSAKQLDFNTALTMDLDLKAESGGFWNSTGRIDIPEFTIRKVGQTLRSQRPMAIVANQGIFNSENLSLTSGENYLKLTVAGLKRSQLNASLNGKLDVSLLGLFTPFISDLRGNMSVAMDLRGTASEPKLSGSAYLEKGYAKFIEFPHPFSNIRADLLFNGNQIVLNSLRSDLAGGKVTGEGQIEFLKNSRPLNVKGTFNNVKLNLPENFRTQGSGKVAIQGNDFPYTMDIDYLVTAGKITFEIGETNAAQASVKASQFLPRFLDQTSFHPFSFNLDVNLTNPVTVENSHMAATVTGRVRVTGTPDRFLLDGSFSPLPGGKVFFGDQVFDVNSAFVEYNQAPADDPKLYLTANARVSESVLDEQGRGSQNQYDVNMLVQGHGQKPQISFTSTPPLGQREIVSLLALGITGASTGTDDRKSSELQNANTSAALGAAILSRAGGKQVKERLGVDVKVSSSQPTPDNASAPKVTLSKQWTPKFGASASSNIGGSQNNNVKLEYKMNQNVSVIGSWEGREDLRDQQKDTTVNVLGLDLQYKVQFK